MPVKEKNAQKKCRTLSEKRNRTLVDLTEDQEKLKKKWVHSSELWKKSLKQLTGHQSIVKRHFHASDLFLVAKPLCKFSGEQKGELFPFTLQCVIASFPTVALVVTVSSLTSSRRGLIFCCFNCVHNGDKVSIWSFSCKRRLLGIKTLRVRKTKTKQNKTVAAH